MKADFEWNPTKAAANRAKHGVHFADAVAVFDDERALTIKDDYSNRAKIVLYQSDWESPGGFWLWSTPIVARRFG